MQALTHFHHTCLQFGDEFQLQVEHWQLNADEHWVILGANGAGKSALAAALVGEGSLQSGQLDNPLGEQTAWVSFEAQAALIEAERRKDDADILDVISEGTPARDYLSPPSQSAPRWALLRELLGVEAFWQRPFRALSTGETRKLLLLNALASDARRLVLDEPYEGLDASAREAFSQILAEEAKARQLVLVINRLEQLPAWITHAAWVEQGRLAWSLPIADKTQLEQLIHLKTQAPTLPPPLSMHATQADSLHSDQPLVILRNAWVAYGEQVVFEGVNWQIQRGEHWQLVGKNGAGKTCLLNLITGDHPQCYQNDLQLFGIQRGTGESIWQIKAHIGYVSSALQWEYRVSISAERVIVSGLYDSIGVYQRIPKAHSELAQAWLAAIGLADKRHQSFNRFSFGEQRLLLIARAMIKHPTLLILDEPCLGLDPLNRRLVLALIEKICAEGNSTVLYVNHHAEDRIQGIHCRYQLEQGQGQAHRESPVS